MAQSKEKIRYAVLGLGWIAQDSVLPAFKHAKENSSLVAFVSGDKPKARKLAKMYNVPHIYSYEEYERCLAGKEIDAVYIASPNHMHLEHTLTAARAGVHVLCEKPMATSTEDCLKMIRECEKNRVKLMIAYRLHFETANLSAIDLTQSGKLGEPRFFNALFSMPIKKGNVRLQEGGGPLFDLGIYCINAARYLFQDEPIEVQAFKERMSGDERFKEVEEMVSVSMRFPRHRLANFICSFGGAPFSSCTLAGTKGFLKLEPAFSHRGPMTCYSKIRDVEKTARFKAHDQFAPEIIYFSNCILNQEIPEPSGLEGMNDVRIIEALYQSLAQEKPTSLQLINKIKPDLTQKITKPPARHPHFVHVQDPSLI